MDGDGRQRPAFFGLVTPKKNERSERKYFSFKPDEDSKTLQEEQQSYISHRHPGSDPATAPSSSGRNASWDHYARPSLLAHAQRTQDVDGRRSMKYEPQAEALYASQPSPPETLGRFGFTKPHQPVSELQKSLNLQNVHNMGAQSSPPGRSTDFVQQTAYDLNYNLLETTTAAEDRRQRSTSVISRGHEDDDDDEMTAMRKVVSRFGDKKAELVEIRQDRDRLKAQLDTAARELGELRAAANQAKESVKKIKASFETKLKESRSSLDLLKAESQATFNSISETKTSLVDVQDLRRQITDARDGITPLLDENGDYAGGRKARAVVNELHLELSKSQEVADMLRERLHSIGAELIEAKEHTSDLDDRHGRERGRLLETVSAQGAQLLSMGETLKAHQTALFDALVDSAAKDRELEALAKEFDESRRNAASVAEAAEATRKELQSMGDADRTRVTELAALLEGKNRDFEDAQDAQIEVAQLRVELGAKGQENASAMQKIQQLDGAHREMEHTNEILQLENEAKGRRVAALESLEHETANVKTALQDRELQIRTLTVSATAAGREIDDLKARLSQTSHQRVESEASLHQLQAELQTCKVDQSTVKAQYEQALAERQLIQAEKSYLEERSGEALAKLRSLQDRFDEQSVTLRMTKEANAELQERMMACERESSDRLLALEREHSIQKTVFEADRVGLQSRVVQLTEAKDVTRTAAADLERKLAFKDDERKLALAQADERIQRAERRLMEADDAGREWREQAHTLSVELATVRNEYQKEVELAQAAVPACTHEQELASLNVRVQALSKENYELSEVKDALIARSKNIEARHKTGDLNAEEGVFIKSLVRRVEAFHDQVLVDKGNELRQRDLKVGKLESRIAVLEKALSEHVDAQTKVLKMNDGQSIMDKHWSSSGPSSDDPAPVPDRDVPSTNIDSITPTAATVAETQPSVAPTTSRITRATVQQTNVLSRNVAHGRRDGVARNPAASSVKDSRKPGVAAAAQEIGSSKTKISAGSDITNSLDSSPPKGAPYTKRQRPVDQETGDVEASTRPVKRAAKETSAEGGEDSTKTVSRPRRRVK